MSLFCQNNLFNHCEPAGVPGIYISVLHTYKMQAYAGIALLHEHAGNTRFTTNMKRTHINIL